MFTPYHSGKVRDIYEVDGNLLMIASDRVSAFDVVLPTRIRDKGACLTQITNFWMRMMEDLVPNHLIELPADLTIPQNWTFAKKLDPVPVECIVRGYLIGSGWKEYQEKGTVCGIELPEGLEMGSRLPEPIFTPSTKADVGDHDENITYAQMVDIVGDEMSSKLESLSLAIYDRAFRHAFARGIIIADTKFEFGTDENGEITLMDEVLTPDSSRFWSLRDYRVGVSPPSFDKQIVRDWLEAECPDWDKTDPGPELPMQIMAQTMAKYVEAWQKLTSEGFTEDETPDEVDTDVGC